MQAETLFQIVNYTAFGAWALLLIIPGSRVARILLFGLVIPLLFAAVYLALFAVYGSEAEGGFGSLLDVALLFQHPHILLAGWVHYLCFDLMVGIWESSDAEKLGINRWFVAPCQILTFLLGPIGLLAYVIVRSIISRRLRLDYP
ncbi:MAG: ABA4-like family protein [bacterium]|nr:ABA4-like family protein [bacterium]